MIFVGHDHTDGVHEPATPDEIAARDLLFACSSEVRRQARAMSDLDRALGGLLELWSGMTDPTDAKPQMKSALLADLQRADHLRQEMEGIARALDLLVEADANAGPIRSETVRACTPLVALQDRLLSACMPEAGFVAAIRS